MEKTIKVNDQLIKYKLLVSSRANRLILTLSRNGEVTVTTPKFVNERGIESFIRQHVGWVTKKRGLLLKRKMLEIPLSISGSYKDSKTKALSLVLATLERYNHYYQFPYKKITIRNQQTRWGSCSKEGNLNFNYRILFLPSYLADYLVVHEICHLRQFNHSEKYWKLVEQTIPDYRRRRKELRRFDIRSV